MIARRALGVDPGLRRVGYSVLERTDSGISLICAGLVVTSGEVSRGDRLKDIYDSLDEVCREHHPTEFVLERILFARNVTSALAVAEAVGVIRLVGVAHGMEATELGANQIKLGLSGDGHAGKAQMQDMVRRLLGLAEPPRPPDVADAIAVAYAHLAGVGGDLSDR